MDRTYYNPSWLNDSNNYNINLIIPEKWKDMFNSINMNDVNKFLLNELNMYGDDTSIFPPQNLVFNAFQKTSPENLKIVILGQDPYINRDQAMGLAFSVPSHITKLPPSLKNIYKKLNKYDSDGILYNNGDLTPWAEQGVLLLNTALTVRQSKSNSHSKIWKSVTDQMIEYISLNFDNITFLLWGNNATSKKNLIDESKHSILISSHPSPLSYNKTMGNYSSFSENDHFEKCFDIIDW